jgi:hypothetical protein
MASISGRMSRILISALLLLVCCAAILRAASTDPNVTGFDRILAGVKPGQTSVMVGDQEFEVTFIRAWRDYLATRGQPGTQSAFQGVVNLWPAGVVPYVFDPSVSVAHRQSFLDAANEWTAFANITFVPRTSQTNYIIVKDGGPGLSGGNSFVGMKNPGPQDLNIGSTSWNRGTLCHEIGHALGLIHEHQRRDRDSFVTIIAANIPGGASDPNFIKLPDSSNQGPYDFLSVMHYSKNAFSTNAVPPGNTIEPKLELQYLNLMGNQYDRVLSTGDRLGIATRYGPPVITPDTVVRNTKDSGSGSLRTAIYKAIDTMAGNISFSIPVADPGFAGGVFTIKVTDGLPRLGQLTTIDATTQTTQTGNTNSSGPEVVLNGSLAQDSVPDGIKIDAMLCTIRGLVINGFRGSGVRFTGTGAMLGQVAGCYIGTNAAGTAAVENGNVGVLIETGAYGNIIGGSTVADRNVISGNHFQGIAIRDSGTNPRDSGTRNNSVRGNYIGLNAAGTAALPNRLAGISIFAGASNNTIGGTSAGARNVISGNINQGVAMSDAGTSNNVVAGNYIGLNAAGTAAVPNGFAGVEMFGSASGNTVGGTTASARNVISGNSPQGVAITGTGSSNNVIAGNFIGTNPAGTAAIPNGYSGVGIFSGATANTVGGTAGGAANVISGNLAQGIYVANSGTNNNVIAGNFVGTNAAGTGALPNSYAGVEIAAGAQLNTVGGFTASARNVLSGNTSQGVALDGAGTSNNRVAGNFIGTNAGGTVALPNGFPGVEIFSAATANTIGGAEPGAGNVISGNSFRGLTITNAGTNNNVIAGNLIGLNAAGTAALANAGPGIQIFGGAQSNMIGGTNGGRNFISGNNAAGLTISDSGTTGNLVQGNSIGTTPTGSVVANTDQGIALFGNAQGNTVGGTTPGAANIITGNATQGVALFGFNVATIRNAILGNSIFDNVGAGIALFNGANDSQSAPTLVSATLGTVGNPGGTDVVGSLSSIASAAFRVEFFASPTADGSSFGEGRFFVGALTVITDGAGTASFTANLAAAIPAGYVVSATATDPAGNTSEFAGNRTVTTTDTDSDGLPNNYETAHGLLVNSNDAALDADGDGESNIDEFRAGTDPRDPTSVLRLPSLAASSGNVVLSLPTLLGKTYRIEYADDLAAPNHWRLFADELLGTGAALPLTDPGAAALPQRFYRALVEP